MRPVDVILAKRSGLAHDRETLDAFVDGFLDGSVHDYQMAAWLMAVFFQGMTGDETAELTHVLAESGRTLDLSDIAPLVADKHSTGGVGDKTTLVVAPLVAALGVPVAKMSGRGLGFAGGTVDKLESFPGLRMDLSADEFRRHLATTGLVITGQSADLAPGDGRIYALRDVTGTVESIPLIASSVMSKKIAAGANVIALDVKVGHGAYIKSLDEARQLARLMVVIGTRLDRKTVATISSMDQPLGMAVGNVLEVEEAIDTLRGGGPDDFREFCLTMAAETVGLAGTMTEREARHAAERALAGGAALETFCRFVESQGGNRDDVLDTSRLPHAPLVVPVPAPRNGFVTMLDAEVVGKASVALGAGRRNKTDAIDRRVGFVCIRKVGDQVSAGEPLALVHAADDVSAQQAVSTVLSAYRFGDSPVAKTPLILERIDA